MLHADDVERLVAWVRERNTPKVEELDIDPFAA
jgi:hypothetical protein